MGIPKKIHRVWLGGSMPEEFRAFGEAWAALHPSWEVRTWGEADLDWLENRAAFDDAPFLTSKSNIARYEIVLREGGLYVDCDFEPLKPLDELFEGADLVVSEERPDNYGNEFFAASAGHPVVAYAVAHVDASHFGQPDGTSYDRTGPYYWTRCVRRCSAGLGLTPTVLSRDQVYPYSWAQPHLRDHRFPEAWAVHHWAKSFVPAAPAPDPVPSAPRRAIGAGARRVKRSVRRVRDRWDLIEPAAAPAPGPSLDVAMYVGGGRLFVDTAAGFPIFAEADDLEVTPALLTDRLHDPGFSRFIDREVGQGDVVVDVGAGIGLHTLGAAFRVLETGRVFAFEPDPARCELLRRSVAMNRSRGLVSEVSIRQQRVGARVAVGDPDAVVLDDVLRTVAEVTLLRVDVDGAEAEVLAGLADALAEHRVRMLDVRLSDEQAGPSWGALASVLREAVTTYEPNLFTITEDGGRAPVSLDAALHGGGLRHLVLELPPPGAVGPR